MDFSLPLHIREFSDVHHGQLQGQGLGDDLNRLSFHDPEIGPQGLVTPYDFVKGLL